MKFLASGLSAIVKTFQVIYSSASECALSLFELHTLILKNELSKFKPALFRKAIFFSQ